MIKGYQSELMDVYQKIRANEEKQLRERRAEIKALYPQILELDNEIHKLSECDNSVRYFACIITITATIVKSIYI